MKPEYVGIGNFDEDNYVYAYCKCPLPVDYAIKWPLIKDGKPHSYTCTCEDCGATVSVITKSYGPEVYKEMEASGRCRMTRVEEVKETIRKIDEDPFCFPSITDRILMDISVSLAIIADSVSKVESEE